MSKLAVYLEVGQKRTFAGAIDWPGWCRIGRDEASALHALVESGPRYNQVLTRTDLMFHLPTTLDELTVVERLPGNTTTDFGAPDMAPSDDTRPLDPTDLDRCLTLLTAYWETFDVAVSAAAGRALRTGPRGGGRDVDGIIRHVLGADASYLGRLAWKFKVNDQADLAQELGRTRQAIEDALKAAGRGETPTQGPRGGVMWTPRYFVRRVGWHVLDHLWEIEDRVQA